jgi:hypothetical protein
MALTGTFDDISFAELLQLLNLGHKSGRLTVWRGTERADIFLSKGEVARAISHRERGPEVVYRILGWREGEFSFERSEEPVAREIKESTEALILEGMKRFDEWERVESEMPNMDVVLRQRASAVTNRFDMLSPEAQTVLRLVDARRNVATIIRESGLAPAKAVMAVTELLTEGMVEKWEAASAREDVLRTSGRLPEARGGIDFGSRTYFSSKEELSQHRLAATGRGRLEGEPGSAPESGVNER